MKLSIFPLIFIDLGFLHAWPNREWSNRPSTSNAVIPDSCSPEEMRLLKRLEKENEQLRDLRRKMEMEWSKPHSPVCQRPYQGFHPGPSLKSDQSKKRNEKNLQVSENKKALWEREKTRLENKRLRLEARKRHRGGGEIRYGAGPCSVRADEPHFFGMSTRMLIAAHEGSLMNDCNEMIELQRELTVVTAELERLETGSGGPSCKVETRVEKSRKKSIVNVKDDMTPEVLPLGDFYYSMK